MNKYFYVSILLGAFALSGCTDDKADNKEFTEEAAPIPLNLTKEQKEDYYNQYLEIVEDLGVEYPSATMGVIPFDEILDEDWVEPEKQRELSINFLENGVFFAN
ncbi:hypothetical protein [Solibacillus sp. R5-41]|uniref:hypothetical protein n=1 Tax=Solibacillus sp. R5-41 TaxID=2048654 RepID=UPI0012FD0AB2|nr:hypothetical protein [Solibacillus sp. R5-41]